MPTLTPRILIIDDDPDSCELIELMLQYSGAASQVTSVQTPEAGLYLAATQRFDLYLLDYRLPGMSGAQACRVIHRMHPDTPIMFFTGAAFERERQEAIEAGATAYLVKPDDLKKIPETVKRLTGGSDPAVIRDVPPSPYLSGAST